jgi:hypothetical protein
MEIINSPSQVVIFAFLFLADYILFKWVIIFYYMIGGFRK